MPDDLDPLYEALRGHGDTLSSHQKRIRELENTVESFPEQVRQVLIDLRDDTDFNRPLWAQGIDHVAEHLGTDKGKRAIESQGFTNLAEWWISVQIKVLRTRLGQALLSIFVGAIGLSLVILLAQSGILGKYLGVK